MFPGWGTTALISANPDYPAYTALVSDIHIVGKVLWKFTRV